MKLAKGLAEVALKNRQKGRGTARPKLLRNAQLIFNILLGAVAKCQKAGP